VRAQKCDRIILFPHQAVAAFQDAGASAVAEDLFGIRSSKSVAGNFLTAFDTLQQEGVTRALCDSKISADRRQEIGGKNVIDRDEVSLFGEM